MILGTSNSYLTHRFSFSVRFFSGNGKKHAWNVGSHQYSSDNQLLSYDDSVLSKDNSDAIPVHRNSQHGQQVFFRSVQSAF